MTAPDHAWLEDEAGQKTDLKAANVTIGRAPANTFVLKDPEQRVSQYHARIERDETGRVFLEDRYSTNGTMVNNERITRRELRDGDKIRFGSRAEYLFRHPRKENAAAYEPTMLGMTARDYQERDCWLMIGDVKGSSALASSLDAGAFARLLTDWASNCNKIAEQHGGTMASRTGDGWLVLWSNAENAAEKVASTMRGLQELRHTKPEPAFRVLLHFGKVVIGGGVRAGEDNVLGADLHQAFRMEKIAAKLGQNVVISEAAQKLLQPFLACHELPGAYELPGFAGLHRFYALAG